MAGGDRRNADPVLIAALAGGATNLDAAQQAGVSEKTVYRRLADAEFRQQVADARAELIARAVGALADASATAATTLRTLLEAESESVRLGAARSILELATRLRASEEFERRLATLEHGQDGGEPHRAA